MGGRTQLVLKSISRDNSSCGSSQLSLCPDWIFQFRQVRLRLVCNQFPSVTFLCCPRVPALITSPGSRILSREKLPYPHLCNQESTCELTPQPSDGILALCGRKVFSLTSLSVTPCQTFFSLTPAGILPCHSLRIAYQSHQLAFFYFSLPKLRLPNTCRVWKINLFSGSWDCQEWPGFLSTELHVCQNMLHILYLYHVLTVSLQVNIRPIWTHL